MKKNFMYAFLSAIALSGAAGFAGCSSSDEIIDNPNYNPETNSVKTQFTISFQNSVAKTRQSANVVQNTPDIANFRGMDQIKLYPFLNEGAVNTDPIAATDTRLGDGIVLKNMIKPNEIDLTTGSYTQNSIPKDATTPAKSLVGTSNSVLYNDVSIPVGTGSFLFYGKAIDETTGGKVVNGSLKPSYDEASYAGTTAGDITFSPEQIYPTGTTPSAVGAALATYLTNIAKAEHWAECATPSDATDYATISANTWFNSGLGALYTKFIELKAGSSRTVEAAVQDLYRTIYKNTDAVSINIRNAILDATYASDARANTTDPLTGNLNFTSTVGNDAATYFPGDVNLPDGAALLSYTASSKIFAQVDNGAGNIATMTAAYEKYVYPASLYYYCNSGIKTSNSSQKDLYDGINTWNQIIAGYNKTAVGAATRSVAILDQIQYGVGRLDAKLNSLAAKLYDKNGDEYVTTNGFTVTGILIGGQKPVKFDFTPQTSTTTTIPVYTIYDNIEKSNSSASMTANQSNASDYNYTLALETEPNTTVYIAVELLNNGEYFQGADGVVPTGGKFYLVAALNPTDAGSISANEHSLTQVFKQDYKTIANFTIPAGTPNTDSTFDPTTGNNTGLGKAYNTIPDLRAPEMELGLSVDLTWENGIIFNITNLGQ
ncbi:MAG: hypothetical protein J6W05_06335 [Prevotella sp.]|nr:hypothetical protein [Prevotella sp.]